MIISGIDKYVCLPLFRGSTQDHQGKAEGMLSLTVNIFGQLFEIKQAE